MERLRDWEQFHFLPPLIIRSTGFVGLGEVGLLELPPPQPIVETKTTTASDRNREADGRGVRQRAIVIAADPVVEAKWMERLALVKT